MSSLEKRGAESEQAEEYTASVWTHVEGGSTTETVNNGYISSSGNTFTGFNIPNYHSRVRKGELLPQTPWYKLDFTWEYQAWRDFFFDVSGETYHRWSSTRVPSPNFQTLVGAQDVISEFVPSSDMSSHVQEAAAKIYTSGFDALTFVAELTEVRQMFVSTLKKLLKLKLPKNWRDCANEWLSWRYGWRILLYDIKNIEEMLQNIDAKINRYSERQGYRYRKSWTDMGTVQDNYGTFDETVEYDIKISETGSVIADISIPDLQFNIVQTAWEIVPLSFVLDWFVSIGKAISAASFLTFNEHYAASYGYRVEYNKTRTLLSEGASSGILYDTTSGTRQTTFNLHVVEERRTPCNVPITPHLTFRINELKVIDLLSLVLQRFRR